jgi:hypothetical protein
MSGLEICISPWQRTVDLLVAAGSLAVAIGLAIRARRHFSAGRGVWGWGMIAGAVASGAVAGLWVICALLGVPPFFMGEIQLLPCDPGEPEQGVALRLSSLPAHPTIQGFVIDDIGARIG